jgi:ketosteroid isomerase-like protein
VVGNFPAPIGVYLQSKQLKGGTMRRLFLIIVLLAGAVAPAITQTADKRTDKSANIEQTVLKLTRDWLDAEERHDRATLQRIIADDFQGTAPMGNTVFKEDVIPQEGTQARGLSVNAQELKARVFGDAAVVTGRGVQKSGEKRELRFTIIFAERKESWQMVAGHLSAVPRE